MTNLPEVTKLELELSDGWLTIWFNTPENRNALSAELAAEFQSVLTAVRDDRSVRGITIRGKGGIFCAGGDLKSFGNALSGEATHEDIYAMNRGGGDMFEMVNTMPQVVIAFVEGAAIAGGLGLMCCADVVIVHDEAKFSLTETKLGIVPAQIAPIVVARTGLPIARRLMLTAAQFKGHETAQLGLSDFTAASVEAMEKIEASIRASVHDCAPGANALTKDILLKTPHLSREEQIDLSANHFAKAMLSDEGRAGIMAFIGKSKPYWAKKDGDE